MEAVEGIVKSFGGHRDEDGRLILGNPEQGCRHCGNICAKVSLDPFGNDTGKAVLYHPGVECCDRAIDDQIRHRQGDIRQLQQQANAEEEHIKQLSDAADMLGRDNRSKEANEARWKEQQALKGRAGKIKFYQSSINDIKAEIGRLERLKEAL